MLVLSRKRNESIVISDNIKITVVDIRGDKVRLGITAPRDIPVHREEVYEAIYGRPCPDPEEIKAQSKPTESAEQAGQKGDEPPQDEATKA